MRNGGDGEPLADAARCARVRGHGPTLDNGGDGVKATAVVGAQAGSEGKGAVVAAIAGHYDVHVRTGGPNAGHTFYYNGNKVVARGLPCGWVNPKAKLVIGPGAVIDWGLLLEEIEHVTVGLGCEGLADRVYIHPNAGVVTAEQHRFEGGVEGQAHQRIGSTGEGVGMARVARISRRSLLRGAEFTHVMASDVPEIAHLVRPYAYGEKDHILLEGTQGSKLSLTHGPWPYVTSADTNAAQLLADAGVPPGAFEETILVARTFPIRVAGNSGPLENETSWAKVGVPEEATTVTGKIRRVGVWNPEWVREAVRLNAPCALVVTFLDYIDPRVAGVIEWGDLTKKAQSWIAKAEAEVGVSVVAVGTGPSTMAFRWPWQVAS